MMAQALVASFQLSIITASLEFCSAVVDYQSII